jgi:hypothetical protein
MITNLKFVRWLLGATWYKYRVGPHYNQADADIAYVREPPRLMDKTNCMLVEIENYKIRPWTKKNYPTYR